MYHYCFVGDQLNAVTIHFDNLNSKEVGEILKYTEPYKTSLKLNTKDELRTPSYGYKSSYVVKILIYL